MESVIKWQTGEPKESGSYLVSIKGKFSEYTTCAMYNTLTGWCHWKTEEKIRFGYKSRLLSNFQQLLICRDAYWKLAGDWKPYWSIYDHKFCIGTDKDKVIEECVTTGNRILAFPTKEMRDVFYENFKELIESVKELI